MHPLEVYLKEIGEIRATGAAVPETSYYGPLAALFNEVGKILKPKVKCIISLKNRGAGLPDGGLFTPDQFQKSSSQPLPGATPARGVIEVKSTKEDAWRTAEGKQVSRYWGEYGQVLVTNLRDFLLVGRDAEGKLAKLEAYRLAASEAEFWNAAQHPKKMAAAHGERFVEYLKRVMLQAAALATPKEVAWFLASYARDAKIRIEAADLPALDTLRAALEEALGLKFEGDKGEHFFRSTLVQTIFYGVFSAWVLWAQKHPPINTKARFDWRTAVWYLHVPMIRALFEQLATPAKLGPLDLVEVLDWTAAALNRVDRASFFEQFHEGQAVQYFYEPFLEAFDPELRKELGVWYTPPEIVRYMVARVDAVLRSELDIPDGLADPRVYVLDPCCGTGAYLVEVLRHIAATLKEKGGDALVGADTKRAVKERVFGFEILPAPFVVAHLQVGLYLQGLGAPLAEEGKERAGVYLTNALTGWEPPQGPKKQLIFPELEEERDAAEEVKREKPILVILGNPPYNAFAGVSPKEEAGLVEPYKEGLIAEWGIKKFNLDELYIRFFRLAERRIAEMTGKGVVCYISNHSWVSDPSFVVLRQCLLNSFDCFWIENMHGNRKISEYAPDGRTSQTIFAIPGFSVGIQQGVAISLWIKSGRIQKRSKVLFRDDLNAAKAVERRAQILESLEDPNFDTHYYPAQPHKNNRFSFRPLTVAAHYLEWPRINDLAIRSFPGIAEDRQKALISIDRAPLQHRMKLYFDPETEWETLAALNTVLTTNVPRFDAKKARKALLTAERYDESRIVRYAMRPFDTQWCYYSPVRPLWREPRPEYWSSYKPGTPAIVTRFKAAKFPEGPPLAFARQLCDYHMMPPNSFIFPIFLHKNRLPKNNNAPQNNLFEESASYEIVQANLSAAARAYLATLGFPDPDAEASLSTAGGRGAPQKQPPANQSWSTGALACASADFPCPTAALIWMHALAVGYAPAYLTENADGIRQDWPRIPLPDQADILKNSARLGREIAQLLDTESPAPGVTAGTLRPEMKTLAVISKVGNGQLDPQAGDLALNARWGYAGKGGITMPGKGRAVAREYTPEEREALREGAAALGLTLEEALKHLGESTFDIYLNEVAYWSNIPEKVWNYYIGGYQVIKKWLSYREEPLLGRALTPEEAREVTHMARRLAAIALMEPALNANYQTVKEFGFPWPQS
jgi:hypothetical protein